MLTILHDIDYKDGRKLEVASAEGTVVSAPSGAICTLAAALIQGGYGADLLVRVVRADPWLYGPPHHVSGVSLRTVAKIDFFADAEDHLNEEVSPPGVTLKKRSSPVR